MTAKPQDRNSLIERYKKLPIELRDFLFDDAVAEKIASVGAANKFSPEQTAMLADIVGGLILGTIPFERFSEKVSTQVTRDISQAILITEIVKKQLFGPIASAIENVYGKEWSIQKNAESTPKEELKKNVVPPPAPPSIPAQESSPKHSPVIIRKAASEKEMLPKLVQPLSPRPVPAPRVPPIIHPIGRTPAASKPTMQEVKPAPTFKPVPQASTPPAQPAPAKPVVVSPQAHEQIKSHTQSPSPQPQLPTKQPEPMHTRIEPVIRPAAPLAAPVTPKPMPPSPSNASSAQKNSTAPWPPSKFDYKKIREAVQKDLESFKKLNEQKEITPPAPSPTGTMPKAPTSPHVITRTELQKKSPEKPHAPPPLPHAGDPYREPVEK